MKPDFQKDIYPCILRGVTTYEGNAEIWFIKVWELLARDGLTEYRNIPEQLAVYSLAAGMCSIYLEVTARLLEYSEPDTLYFDVDPVCFGGCNPETEPEKAAALRAFLSEAVCNEQGMRTVLRVLKKHLGINKTFAAIYYCLHYEQFSLEDWETDEYYYGDIDDPDELRSARDDNYDYERRKELASCTDDLELLDMILNEVDTPRTEAYEWLTENM